VALFDVLVNLSLVIPVVGQRRVNLSHAECGMLEMKLFWAPTIGEVIKHNLDDFDACAGNDGYLRLVEDYMFVSSLPNHKRLPSRAKVYVADLHIAKGLTPVRFLDGRGEEMFTLNGIRCND